MRKIYRVANVPYRLINDSTNYSRVNGCHLPIAYKFVRGDYDGLTQDESGNTGVLSLSGAQYMDLSTGASVNVVFFTVDNGLVITSQVNTTILNKVSDSLLILDLPFTTAQSVLINDLAISNYRIETNLKAFPSSTIETIASFVNSQDLNLTFNINPAPYLKSLVAFTDSFDYAIGNSSGINTRGFGFYTMEFTSKLTYNGEEIEETTDVEYFDLEELQIFLNGVKQMGEKYGNNFADYQTDPLSTTYAKLFTGTQIKKQLTYFYGYPMTASFFGHNLNVGDVAKAKRVVKDINGNVLTTLKTTINFDEQFRFYNIIKTWLTVYSDAYSFDLSLIRVDGSSNEYDLTQTYNYKIERRCFENGTYLSWLNTEGGRCYWLFENYQLLQENQNSQLFYPYSEDIETQITNDVLIANDAREKKILSANVSINDYEMLTTLFRSKNICILQNPETWETDGAKWFETRIEENSFKMNFSRDERVDFSFTILLNNINIQSE